MPYQNYDCERFSDLKQMLRTVANKNPDAPMWFDKQSGWDHPIRYRRFADDVEALSAELIAAGLGGEHVAMIGESGHAWARAFLAVACSGGVAVPIDKDLSPATIAELIELCDVRAVLVSERLTDKLAGVDADVRRIGFAELEAWADRGSRQIYYSGDHSLWQAPIDANSPCLLMPTRDDSGNRTAVMLSHANICFALSQISQMVSIGNKDRFFSAFPIYRLHGLLTGLLWPFSRGAAVTFSMDFHEMIDDMRALQPTALLGAQVLFERIYDKLWENIRRQGMENEIRLAIKTTDAIAGEKAKLTSKRSVFAQIHKTFGGELRVLIPCGGRLDCAVVSGLRALGFLPIAGLGTAETTGLISMNRDLYYRDGSLGLVTPDVLLDIADEGPDGVGEIRVRGKQVMMGYYNAPERTKQRVRDGWFYTGVRAYQDDDGFVHVVGMQKNAFMGAGGVWISPEVLEVLLAEIGQVRDAAILGYPLTGNGLDVVALIVPQDGVGEPELKRAIAELNASLTDYQRIREFVILDVPLERGADQQLRRGGLLALFEKEWQKG